MKPHRDIIPLIILVVVCIYPTTWMETTMADTILGIQIPLNDGQNIGKTEFETRLNQPVKFNLEPEDCGCETIDPEIDAWVSIENEQRPESLPIDEIAQPESQKF